jgi:CPA2 family monovalent cation:H+ antiporter-2
MNDLSYMEFLPNILYLISTALFVVIIFRKLKLSPVLGYLVAGAFIGDHSLQIISYNDISAFAEFGIVFLLFAIGLELTFERLKLMHKYVFGFGTLQVITTASVIALFIILVYSSG